MEDNVDYGKATYSVAMIYLNDYEEVLKNFGNRCKDVDRIFYYILSKKSQSEDFKYLLNEHVLPVYVTASKLLTSIENEVEKYRLKLEAFLGANPEENEDFNGKRSLVLSRVKFYQEDIDSKIKQCFEYNKDYNENLLK